MRKEGHLDNQIHMDCYLKNRTFILIVGNSIIAWIIKYNFLSLRWANYWNIYLEVDLNIHLLKQETPSDLSTVSNVACAVWPNILLLPRLTLPAKSSGHQHFSPWPSYLDCPTKYIQGRSYSSLFIHFAISNIIITTHLF